MMSPGIRSGVNWMRPNSSPSALREAVRQQGLGRARRPFEQDVAAGEQRHQHQVDRLGLADHGLGDLGSDRLGELLDFVDLHVAISSSQ